MISEEKIRMMTQAAMMKKREERRAIEICGYRKKDYVFFQMIKIWISYTAAYLLLTLVGIVCTGGGMKMVSFSEHTLITITVIWIIAYLGFLTAALVMARRCYSRRYRTAAVLVRQYRQQLMTFEDFCTERSQANDSSAGTSAKNK